MAKTVTYSAIFLIFLVISNAETKSSETKETRFGPLTKGSYKLPKGIDQFSLTLFQRMAIDIGDRNFVVSPLSVWTGLTILSKGAIGETFTELKQALRLPANDTIKYGEIYKLIEKAFIPPTSTGELTSTNRIFVDSKYNINSTFMNQVINDYSTDILSSINFSDRNAASVINNKIRSDTKEKIPQLVTRDDLSDASMILTNGAYFKGQWFYPFNTSQTKVETFYNHQKEPIGNVSLMCQRGPFPYLNIEHFQSHVIELPYGNLNRLSMIVMIPYYMNSLHQFYEIFTKFEIDEVINALQDAADEYEDDEIEICLPRMTIDSDFVLNEMLINMGLFNLFDIKYSDLSYISSEGNLFLSRLIHKVVIEVREEGTVSTAETAEKLTNRSPPIKVMANKPFIFFVYDKITKFFVFCGRYIEPSVI